MINLFNIKYLFIYLFLHYISKYNHTVKHFTCEKLLQQILFNIKQLLIFLQ